jgi:opacity protein-like surface antigen
MMKRQQLYLIPLLLISTPTYPVEVTPLIGIRGGGEFIDTDTNKKHTVVSSETYGVIIGFPYEKGKDIELYYSHQSSDINSVNVDLPSETGEVDIPLTIDYLHIGGTTPINIDEKLKTFVSGGLGFTYLSPDLDGLQSDLRASFSLGVGLKYPVTDNIALRLETRALATLYNSNSALFCNGGCSLTVNGSLFIQTEIFAGVAINF